MSKRSSLRNTGAKNDPTGCTPLMEAIRSASEHNTIHNTQHNLMIHQRSKTKNRLNPSTYEGCPESIQPFWISLEPVAWQWCNLAASQRRPYCVSVKSHSSVGLVSRQWDAVDWACVLCDHHSSLSTAILALGKTRRRRELNLGCRGADWVMRCFAHPPPKKKLHESRRIGRRNEADSLICSLGYCECDGHTVHRLNQRRLTADLLDQRESECPRVRSKVSSDWLPGNIKVTPPVLETFKLAGYIPNGPRTHFIHKHKKPNRGPFGPFSPKPETKLRRQT